MSRTAASRVALLSALLCVGGAWSLAAEGEKQAKPPAAQDAAADAAVKLFDTGSASSAPLSGETVAKKAGWKQVPEDKTDHAFAGDTVLVNDHLAVVLRRGGPGAEVYGRGQKGFTLRAVLAPAAKTPEVKLASLAITDNSPGAVAVDATFKATDGTPMTVSYELPTGQLYVKTEARAGVEALAVDAPSRFVVLPDFFADDMVVDAAQIPVSSAELPSENFLVNLLPDKNAIVMTVADSRDQDARVTLSGQDAQRVIGRSEIYYGNKGKVWVAVLEAPGIWHQRDVAKSEANKIVPLDWTAPFAAQWRVDFAASGGKLTNSWEMIVERPDGKFQRFPMWGNGVGTVPADRKCWATVYANYIFPCWLDHSARGYLQPMAKPIRYEGPAIVYPINRLKVTPLDQFAVVDVVRATLGVGPCQYVLDVEGQGTHNKGIATCGCRDIVVPIYEANQQKAQRKRIEKALTDVVVFVKFIRARIGEYADFGHQMLAYLAEQKKAHPENTEFLTEMETLTKTIDANIAKRQELIKTPQYVVDLTEEFRNKLLDAEGPEAAKECTRIAEAIVVVGGNQDHLVGECRVAVKALRQRAGLAMATNPGAADVANEIRERTQKILRNPAVHEFPRH